jgi:hypothetical protein
MHVEYLMVDEQKMSKSLGNTYTIPDIVAKGYRASAVRYLLLSAYYRKQVELHLGQPRARRGRAPAPDRLPGASRRDDRRWNPPGNRGAHRGSPARFRGSDDAGSEHRRRARGDVRTGPRPELGD